MIEKKKKSACILRVSFFLLVFVLMSLNGLKEKNKTNYKIVNTTLVMLLLAQP